MEICEEIIKICNDNPDLKKLLCTVERVDELEHKLSSIESMITGSGDLCPNCKKPTGRLKGIMTNNNCISYDKKIYSFKCIECDTMWEKIIK